MEISQKDQTIDFMKHAHLRVVEQNKQLRNKNDEVVVKLEDLVLKIKELRLNNEDLLKIKAKYMQLNEDHSDLQGKHENMTIINSKITEKIKELERDLNNKEKENVNLLNELTQVKENNNILDKIIFDNKSKLSNNDKALEKLNSDL